MEAQKQELHGLLFKYTKLFSSTLGIYTHRKFHIDVNPKATPHHVWTYSVPHIHHDTFKKELDHLVSLGVLSPQGASEWAACGTFIIPKKDGCICWISDLCQLNKVIKRRTHPLPIINDIL